MHQVEEANVCDRYPLTFAPGVKVQQKSAYAGHLDSSLRVVCLAPG